jgi:hypothetical protein
MTKLKQARPLLSTTRYTVAQLIRNGLPISAVANLSAAAESSRVPGIAGRRARSFVRLINIVAL